MAISAWPPGTVLRGSMEIHLDDEGPYRLGAGDEVVILPGTAHEVVEQASEGKPTAGDLKLLVRVHATNSRGRRITMCN